MVAYHELLDRDPQWALEQGGRFFMGLSEVNLTLSRITSRLDELGVPYALIGGMALFQYGYRRFTEVVDLLVRGEDLPKIHKALEGRGYLPKFPKSRNLRDTDSAVAIEFLISGEFPGDGKPKPVAFPDPAAVVEVVNGLKCINLVSLVEMKLASGMTTIGRVADLGDVIKLAELLNLGQSFAEQLNPYVRSKFEELVFREKDVRKYKSLWQSDVLATDLRSIRELAEMESSKSDLLLAMEADGVMLEPSGAPGSYWFVTNDPDVASKYDMHDESEFMD